MRGFRVGRCVCYAMLRNVTFPGVCAALLGLMAACKKGEAKTARFPGTLRGAAEPPVGAGGNFGKSGWRRIMRQTF